MQIKSFTSAVLLLMAVIGPSQSTRAGSSRITPSDLKMVVTATLPKEWGTTYKAKLSSKILGATRTVDLFVPRSFQSTKRRYPVIFLSDGEYNFEQATVASHELSEAGHIPECIVAAIETPQRTQDLTPPGMSKFLAEGEERGDKFLGFITKELRPELESRLRASRPSILLGHSHGGILVHYAAAKWRKDFPFLLALDTPTHLENAWLVKRLMESLNEGGGLRLVSYECVFGWSDDNWAKFVAAAPKGWKLTRTKLPNETHQSLVFTGFYLGLKELFSDYSLASVKNLSGPKAFAHYESLTPQYGAAVTPPESVLRRAVDEITITGDGPAAHRALKALAQGYGEPEDRATLEKRIDVAAAKMKGQPSVEDLMAMQKPSEEEIRPYLGTWEGHEHVEGGPTTSSTLKFSMKDGRGAGELILHDEGGEDMSEPLTYLKVVPGGIEFGFLNGVFPQAIVNHIGMLKDGKIVGKQAFAGVYFVPLFGEELPKWTFSFERKKT